MIIWNTKGKTLNVRQRRFHLTTKIIQILTLTTYCKSDIKLHTS